MDKTFLRQIRENEAETILSFLEPRSCVLEVGAGAGWQANVLANMGHNVEAIDVESSIYRNDDVFCVKLFDGSHIPYQDETFDVVFSSNALEHIPDLERFQFEITRVLKHTGKAIHVVPSASWRFWTIIALYFHLAKLLFKKLNEGSKGSTGVCEEHRNITGQTWSGSKKLSHLSNLRSIMMILVPERHGQKGSVVSELFTFSRGFWKKSFHRSGWSTEKVFSNQLFYTGHLVLGDNLGLRSRRWLSFILGSSCHIFVLRRP